jgi:hypothetical protein
MTLYCRICHAPFKDGEEVRFIGDAHWHALASRAVYSISKPHNVIRDSLVHTDCDETDALSEV